MSWRNIPLFLLTAFFLGMLAFVLETSRVQAPREESPEVLEDSNSFAGRVVMPSLEDMYVLENSSGRDLVRFRMFLQGRAAGLHWLASSHFKQKKGSRETLPDVLMGVRLTLDSLGIFHPEIVYSSTNDDELKSLVCRHIQAYWRYPRSTQGKFEVWFPITWKFRWK